MFLPKIAGVGIYRLGEFCNAFGSFLLLFKLYACIMRALVHVLCACCSFFIFLGHASQSMMHAIFMLFCQFFSTYRIVVNARGGAWVFCYACGFS